MSDASQGPGWWQASDGRWYPPEQPPALRPDLPPPPAATPPAWPTAAAAATPSTPTTSVKPSGDADGCAKGFMAIMVGLMLLCGVGLLWGAIKGDDSTSASGADASASVACGHFRNVANDAAKGVLGADQLLPKMREVYDSASVSDNIRVRTAAQQLLAAVTADNDASAQVQEMSAACTAIGE